MERKLTELIDKAVSRRSFLTGASAIAAGTLVIGCSDNGSTPTTTTTTTTTTPTTTLGDADYLNFALNLEYLEAEFYLRAATGTGLSATDSGNSTSKTTGGSMIPGLSAVQSSYLNEIAQNELDHVRFLRAALTTSAVAAPAIDLTASFNGLASLAKIGSTFNPFDNYNDYLLGAFIFEDVGVTAYHGAAPLLKVKAYLTAAAEIHAVEAYHAASIRSQIVQVGGTLLTNANAVQTVRASVGGGKETTLSSTTIVAADPTNSIGFSRMPSEVLAIVYAGGSGKGGFFPAGLNGNIK